MNDAFLFVLGIAVWFLTALLWVLHFQLKDRGGQMNGSRGGGLNASRNRQGDSPSGLFTSLPSSFHIPRRWE